MAGTRRLVRAGFTLERDYPVPHERLWAAFAREEEKRAWFGEDDAYEPGAWSFDFRVGGRDVAEGAFHDGPVSRYEAVYVDIVEPERIVTVCDMWIDGVHMSTSLASYELEATPRGSRLVHVEHGVFFDGFAGGGPGREEGSRGVLDALGRHLAQDRT